MGDPTNLSPSMVQAILDHPLRRRISREVLEIARPVSLVEIAQRLQEPLSRVNYHAYLLAGGKTPAIVREGIEPAGGSFRPLYAPSRTLSEVSLLLLGEPPSRGPDRESS